VRKRKRGKIERYGEYKSIHKGERERCRQREIERVYVVKEI